MGNPLLDPVEGITLEQWAAVNAKIVAGTTTSGKGGTEIQGVPVYDTVAEAQEKCSANASIIFVPAPFAADAAFEALENGIKTVVRLLNDWLVRKRILHTVMLGLPLIRQNKPLSN